MTYPTSTVRLALEYAREAVVEEPRSSVHGALFAACSRIEHKLADQSALYSAARLVLDQTERLALLDRAIAALMEEK